MSAARSASSSSSAGRASTSSPTARSSSPAAPRSCRSCATGCSTPRRSSTCSRSLPRGIDGDARIGAATTLAELEASDAGPGRPARGLPPRRLAAAARAWARSAATCSSRRAAGTGGSKYPCRLHGGDTCHARDGEHREHAIFGNDFCASAHPSDLAAALLALGATLRTNRRELPVAELYRLPTEDDRRTTTLEPGEVILELDVPPPTRPSYLKAMDRKRFGVPARRRRRRPARRRDDGRARRRRADPVAARRLARRRRRRCPAPRTRSRSRPRSSRARSPRRLTRSIAARCAALRPPRPARRCVLLAALRRRRRLGHDDERHGARRRRATITCCTPSPRRRPRRARRKAPTPSARPVEDATRSRWRRTAAASRSRSTRRSRRTRPRRSSSLVQHGLLRQDDLPPHRPGLRDPGRRPDRDRHRRPGLLDRRHAAGGRAVHARRRRDGEDRRRAAGHGGQPVLRRHRRRRRASRPTTRSSATSRDGLDVVDAIGTARRRRRAADAGRRDREGDRQP